MLSSPARAVLLAALTCAALPLAAADAPSPFLDFIRAKAAALRGADSPPATREAWTRERGPLRARLLDAMGGLAPSQDHGSARSPVAARILGVLDRDGYRVEKLVLETLPGVLMTANAYVPASPGRHPAVLAVHGHWPGAKQDPVVQERCLGLVKLGYIVLAVDAFGAGERGVGKALGEYHGDMTAATLLPTGVTLAGVQQFENRRAVDYLLTRPDVDGTRLGVTGASGGGNQTMYAAALDDRLGVAVPVCSVGNYQAYLGVGCCLCEVIPGALTFTEEDRVLGLIAPRPLLVINATLDSSQFSVAAATVSLRGARSIYGLYDVAGRLRHATFDSPHAYSAPMRETMYGWMAAHLQAAGVADPIPEPAHATEPPETLRCFPGDSRPDDFVTLPRWAAREGRRLVARIRIPDAGDAARSDADRRRAALRSRLGLTAAISPAASGFTQAQPAGDQPTQPGAAAAPVPVSPGNSHPTTAPAPGIPVVASSAPAALTTSAGSRGAVATADFPNSVVPAKREIITLTPEPGVGLAVQIDAVAGGDDRRIALLLDLEGAEHARTVPCFAQLLSAGWSVVTFDLRATGAQAVARAHVGRAPDHHPAEWALWLGRPLLGQWVTDVQSTITTVAARVSRPPVNVAVIGVGAAGTIALATGASDVRCTHVVSAGALASVIADRPYEKQWLGLVVPGLLRDVGDLAHVAGLIAPRRLLIAGAVDATAEPLTAARLETEFAPTRRSYAAHSVNGVLQVTTSFTPGDLAAFLR